MSYDFDRIIDRRGTSSLKWEVSGNELPMWVADMDFETAPAVREALRKAVDHGIFGYTILPEEWYSSIMRWWEERHGLTMEKDWLIFSTGVIPSISTCVRKLTSPGENVLVQTPVYNMFFNSIVNNGRNVLENPLIYDRETTSYRIDWEDLGKKLANPQTSMMILCNPHNPIGKIWDRETLARIGELCAAHHVTVISDEIHCDLTEPGCDYIPFASVSETCRDNSITCIAPTKAFNIACLHSSAVIVPEK
ncbi:MAG: aminotransferase class I/II-fold pyridoxal phosphate-dependent enzyme, partial [Clostridiales bacterium]|nr:aminotransferase class I/II-fold pyridoxal phosphate-dependent enzyme [Clostridiales bacterium]